MGRQGVGSPGRWVEWALGARQGRPRDVGFWALGALGRRRRGLRTGYFARGLRTLSRSNSEVGVAIRGGSFFPFFGRWVARALGREGVGWAAGSPPGSQVDDEVTLPGLRYPVRKPRSSTARRYSRRRYRCPVGPAIAERWVARALGPQGVGSRQGRPRVVKSTTRPLYRDFDGPLGSTDRAHYDGIVAVAIGAL